MNLFIGDTAFRPTQRSVMMDTGTSMIMIYQRDLKKIMSILCNEISANVQPKFESKPQCHGIGFGYFQIAGCSPEVRAALPPIQFQIGSYVYELRPEKYTTYKGWT